MTAIAARGGRSRRLRVVHTTGFGYPGPVLSSYNEARLTPLTTPTQTTLEADVSVEPQATTLRYWDYWGTQVTAFDVHEPHERLAVTATSVVETVDLPVAPVAATWSDLRAPAVTEQCAEWLAPTPRTRTGPEPVALARDLVGDSSPSEAGRHVAQWLASTVDYVPGATGVHTSAEQAWDVRQGVCQDFAHIAVGVLRALGVPARYVSGYLHPQPDADVGAVVRGESHAWVEWWAGAWEAWDPTNGKPAGADHVVVGRGRDYGDVPPLKGVYSGPGGSELFVEVEVTRLA